MPLNASKYAPKAPAESASVSRDDRVRQDRDKAGRLLGRLRWKAESLLASYERAVRLVHAELNMNGYGTLIGEGNYPFVNGMTAVQVESMFKVDFFEFYTLLERLIYLCLSILGVYVSGMAPRSNVNALRFITNPEFARTRDEASHQFHANLLDALDNPTNPLHPALGRQEVRIQLGLAKDYRNRWKDADEQLTRPSSERQSEEDRKRPIQIDELSLKKMLHLILQGCVDSVTIVNSHDSGARSNERTDRYTPYPDMMVETEDTPLEYMEDAMDLD